MRDSVTAEHDSATLFASFDPSDGLTQCISAWRSRTPLCHCPTPSCCLPHASSFLAFVLYLARTTHACLICVTSRSRSYRGNRMHCRCFSPVSQDGASGWIQRPSR